MQLNSLTLNSNTHSAQSKSQLPVYDHKLTIIGRQIFVFGKNIQNFSIQTPLHKINTKNLRVQHVYSMNAPLFKDFIMFSFQKILYFWGKTSHSQKNQLFQFDGLKFNQLTQYGSTPEIQAPFTFSTFSKQYLILFGRLKDKQFLNKLYFFDIKKRQWKQIFSDIQLPNYLSSSLIWKNGRGYLLLQLGQKQSQRTIQKNILYELKFQNFNKMIIKCVQIPFSSNILTKNLNFTHIFSFEDNFLMIIGGQKNQNFHDNEQKRINFDTYKIVYKFDLEIFQWSNQYKIVQIKGYDHQFIFQNQIIYAVGGTFNGTLFQEIQKYDFRNKQQKQKLSSQQGQCYQCQSAYSYTQKFLYSTFLQKQYQSIYPHIKVQNKVFKKCAEYFSTQLQAITAIVSFLKQINCSQIKINLCQQIRHDSYIYQLKQKIENVPTQVLRVEGLIQKPLSGSLLIETFDNNQNIISYQKNQNFIMNFIKNKIASFKIGYGLLFVTLTAENEIFVGYTSCSQTEFSQCQANSFNQIFYKLSLAQGKQQVQCSSPLNRQIIYQNLKLYFRNFQDYQKTTLLKKKRLYNQKNRIFIYIVGSTNLQKQFNIQIKYNKCLQDIKVKSLNKRSNQNSLRNYLKHYYLDQDLKLKIYIQDYNLQFIDIYQIYRSFNKSNYLKQILTNEDAITKSEQQDTHFSTNNDESMILWKKTQIASKCRLYQINLKKSFNVDKIYKRIFIYKNKKLLKTITLKRQNICGIIELSQNVQITLNQDNFTFQKDEKKLKLWIQTISNSLQNQNISSTQDI